VSQPAPFNRSFSFSNFQAANPTGALPGSQVDLELNNAKSSIDGVLTNLALIQRDDGALKNGSVTFDTLSPSLQTAGLAPALPWVTGATYAMSVSVTHGSAFYRSLVPHTSGVFATDLAAGKWVLIVDFATIALVAASLIAVTPSGSLTTDVQTSLQALDTGKAPLSHTQVSSTISDSTAAGRALLTAADVPTQQSLLGFTVLGFQPGNIKETAGIVLEPGWYYCDGSNKNRVTDVNLFNAITIQQSGVLTSASAVVTGLSDTSSMSPGMPISGTGVQALTVIQSVDSGTQITMSLTATASATTPLVFAPYGVGDGSTTFGLPNRAYVAVGRDNASGSATNVMQVSTTISTTSASATATVASATGLFVGMYVSHPKVPSGTKINTIVGTTLTLSAVATGTVSGSAARFSPVLDAQTLGAVGGATNQTLSLAQIPTGITSANAAQNITVTVTGPTGANLFWLGGGNARGYANGASNFNDGQASFTGTTSNSISVTSNNTGGAAHANVQPTIVMNYIIKR
jgi:microcystin-dependent protein